MHCRFGNRVDGSNASFSFVAEAEGPGPVDTAIDCVQAGPSRVHLLARQAGTYSLMLVRSHQETLGNCPIQVSPHQEVLRNCPIQVCLHQAYVQGHASATQGAADSMEVLFAYLVSAKLAMILRFVMYCRHTCQQQLHVQTLAAGCCWGIVGTAMGGMCNPCKLAKMCVLRWTCVICMAIWQVSIDCPCCIHHA